MIGDSLIDLFVAAFVAMSGALSALTIFWIAGSLIDKLFGKDEEERDV